MAGLAPDVLTAAGALATAVFTLGIVVLTWMGYKHLRTQAGLRRPLTFRFPENQATFVADVDSLSGSMEILAVDQWHRYRKGYLHMFNHSDFEQKLLVSQDHSHVLRLGRRVTHLRPVLQDWVFKPHSGGAVGIVFECGTGEWPESEPIPAGWQSTYLLTRRVKLQFHTESHLKCTYRGRITFGPFTGGRR